MGLMYKCSVQMVGSHNYEWALSVCAPEIVSLMVFKIRTVFYFVTEGLKSI